MNENAYIIYNNGKVLETMRVKSIGFKADNVYPYTLTRSVEYGGNNN